MARRAHVWTLYTKVTTEVSTTSRIKRAQLVGHLVRHSCLYTHASMWRHNEESKFPTTIEQCARDLNLLVSEVFVQAQDRSHWSSLIGQLRKRLEPNHGVTTFGSTKWMNEYKRTSKDTTYENLQFLEEGPNVFPLNRNKVHLYTDGCLIRKQGKMQCGVRHISTGASASNYKFRFKASGGNRTNLFQLRDVCPL